VVPSLPRSVVLDRAALELADVDVVQERLEPQRYFPPRQDDLGSLECSRKAGVDAEVELHLRQLFPQEPRLRAALLGQGDRNRGIAVDPVLEVEGRFPVTGQHVQLHGAQAIRAVSRSLRGVWSNGSMAPQIEELPDNKVRLTVDVPKADVHHAVEHAASDLASSVKIPGFRKGKVPMPVLVNRIGKERLYSEAIESHIAAWYSNAVATARIRPADQPELDYELPDSEDQDWRFTATVPVLPKPEVVDWKQLQVPYAEPEIPEDLVDHELNVLRSTVAELAPVSDRPAQAGDSIVLDLNTDDGGGQKDYVVELGSGRLIPELEEGLVGMSAGETKEIALERAGEEEPVKVEAVVKEIKEKVLPELDDELARSASEFDTLDELRADIGQRIREQVEAEVDEAFRRAVLDRLVEASNVQVTGPLVDARTRTLLRELDAVLQRSGGSLDAYLQMSGDSPENLVARLQEQAAASVAGELVLETAADQLGIQVSDEEVDQAFRDRFEEGDRIIEQARAAGAYDTERENMRLARALDTIAQEVERIPPEQAAAREAIWTPDKEKPATDTKLWTPGTKEPA
jgi:trigger factor